ncbi:IS4 family transposase [Longimicrobium terrae]|nr:IS4 family transposase [Longimicrobium terrae]
MARTKQLRQEENRLADLMNIGVLTTRFPMDQVHAILNQTGRASERVRALPAHVLVYYIIALGLFRPLSTQEVLRVLQQGLKDIAMRTGRAKGAKPVKTAGAPAISQARTRLGVEPVKQLYEQVVRPVAERGTEGAWYRERLLVAMDGFTLEVPDSEANRTAFARPESPSGGESAYPRIRGVGLVEVGTHVLFGAALDSYAVGEITLARRVVPHLRAGMICLADRYFPGYPLWKQATETGAELVWRVREKIRFPVEKRLPDGSWLSHFQPSRAKGGPVGEPIPVRVIEYRVSGGGENIRIITSILDPEAAPAQELATLYHERWEFETALDEFKTHLRGARTVLRSQTPELVRQEVYGILPAHFALRGLMHEAALRGGRDPDRISFTHTVNVVRRTLPGFAALPPSGVDAAPRSRAGRDSGRGRRRASPPEGKAGREAQAEPLPRPAPERAV